MCRALYPGGRRSDNAFVSGLFISYRRQDAAGHAGRLRSDLARRYGDERVFLDVADLAPGADWAAQLHASGQA